MSDYIRAIASPDKGNTGLNIEGDLSDSWYSGGKVDTADVG